MVLRAENVAKAYFQGEDRLEILRGVSIAIEKSERVAIMGRSGCGKSTLISLLAGLDEPTSGTIEILGQRLDALSGRELNSFRARHIGIVFQQFNLLDHLTALENVRLPLDLNRIASADELAAQMLERVGLGHRGHHLPDQMSRGECQRVAIARVLVMKPEILLADEPTGSLDVKTGRDVVELIFRLSETEGFALLMATHDPVVARGCGRLLYMNQGQLGLEPAAGFA